MSVVISLFLGVSVINQARAQRIVSGTPIPNPKKPVVTPKKNGKNIAIKDTIKADTLTKLLPDSLKKNNDLQTTVVYAAKDSTVMDTQNQVVYLYGEAKVNYGDVILEADYIKLNWDKSEVIASGTRDSVTKKTVGKPVFKQGGEPYDADEIKYNFKSRKAIIKGLITKQGDAYVQGVSVKKDDEDNLYIRNAVYTTCDLAHPHYNIRASRIKMVGKKEIVSGPFRFELNEIPLPIGLPFGFFPYKPPQENGTSGIIVPTQGDESFGRGFFLREGGYYFAINQNIGLKLLGEIYSKGSFGITAQSQYVKRYRYGGGFNVNLRSYNNGKEFNDPGSLSYGIQWNHSPQSRAGSSFSASVNIQSSGNQRFDNVNSNSYISSSLNSSVQYSKNFGQSIRSSVSVQSDQNIQTKVTNLNTNFAFGINQFQPFKNKKAVTEKFWDGFRMGFDLNGSYGLTNKVALSEREYDNFPYTVYRLRDTTDLDKTKPLRPQTLQETLNSPANLARDGVDPGGLFGEAALKNAKLKMQFSIPISLPNVKIGKYINLTPGMSLSGNIYTQTFKYVFKKDNDLAALYSKDTTRKKGAIQIIPDNNPAIDYTASFSASMNTRMYGTINFKKGRLQGIRHIISPSVSFSYAPDFSDPNNSNPFFQTVQINNRKHIITPSERELIGKFYINPNNKEQFDEMAKALYKKDSLPGDFLNLSRFDPRISGIGSRSGGISFGFQNTLEAKLRAKSDTATKDSEKITLLDNFSVNGNYNFFAKEFQWSNFNFTASSRVKKFDIAFGGSLDPYSYVKDGFSLSGRRVNILKWDIGDGLAQLANFNFSVSKSFKPKGSKEKKISNPENGTENEVRQINRNINQYIDWDVPWNFQFGYQYNMNRTGFAPATIVSAVTFSGDLKLTEKWNFKLSSGYDFVNKAVSLTNVQITRNLHCWEAIFNWTPAASPLYGRTSSYSFEIHVRSALLRDLKLTRSRTFFDRGGF